MNNSANYTYLKFLGKAVMVQILTTIIGISLALGSGFIFVEIALQLITFIFYFYLLYSTVWKIGNKDKSKDKLYNTGISWVKGFKLGLFASIPQFLLAFLLIVDKLKNIGNTLIIFKLLNLHFYYPVKWIIGELSTEILSIGSLSWLQVALLVSLTFVMPIITGLAYIFGVKDMVFLYKIIYKPKKD